MSRIVRALRAPCAWPPLTSDVRPRQMPAPPIMFGLVIAAVGVVLAVYGVFILRAAIRSLHWPSVVGRICDASIAETRSAASDAVYNEKTFRPAIRYAYDVAGTHYEGELVAFGLRNLHSSKAYAERYLARYPVNSTVWVFYDTTNPKQAVLEPGYSVRSLAPLAGALMFLAFGLLTIRVWTI
jgi:hypothetical protein